MRWGWLDLAFPWIGLAGAVVLVAVLFGTNALRSEPGTSRWKDHTWLAWLAVVAYLLHNVEEYGVDLLGHRHAFPDTLCTTLGQPAYPGCPIPPAFYLAVNLPLFWAVAPLIAFLSRRRPPLGLALYGVIFINGLAHTALFLRSGLHYNPGLLTAAAVFLPLSAWVATTTRARGFLVACGAGVHVVLAGSVILFINGSIGSTVLVCVQLANAVLFLYALRWS